MNPNSGTAPPSTSLSRGSETRSGDTRWNLLLAEDNLPDALLIRQAIQAEGLPVEIFPVVDGEEAVAFIDRASADPGAPCPQLIVLDLNLPKIDGFEVLRYLRSRAHCKDVPVMIVTSSNAPDDRQFAAALRASYFRKTPSYLEFMKLGEAIRQILPRQSNTA